MVLQEICDSDEETQERALGILSMPDISEDELVQSFHTTLNSQGFENMKGPILEMVKNGELEKAISYTSATQRAMMRAITSLLYNPFYTALDDK